MLIRVVLIQETPSYAVIDRVVAAQVLASLPMFKIRVDRARCRRFRVMRVRLWTSFWWTQSPRICQVNRTVRRIRIKIDPTPKAIRVFRNKSAGCRIVVSGAIVVWFDAFVYQGLKGQRTEMDDYLRRDSVKGLLPPPSAHN